MTVTTSESLAADLRRMLGEPLPGLQAQLRMAPSHRSQLLAERDDGSAREAAVLVLLENSADVSIILTERRHDLDSHPGQISFPGGRREPQETLLDTALREAAEEVSLESHSVEILGELTPLHVPPSNYVVHPFVGFAGRKLDLAPADNEVSLIIRASLAGLMDPQNSRTEERERYGAIVNIPYFNVGGHKVWGATAMMLAELIELLRRA